MTAVLVILTTLYIGRCWYVSTHILDHVPGGEFCDPEFVWLSPSLNKTAHFHYSNHASAVVGAGVDKFYVNKCVHLWKNELLHAERHLSFGSPYIDTAPYQCALDNNPTNGWITTWMTFE